MRLSVRPSIECCLHDLTNLTQSFKKARKLRKEFYIKATENRETIGHEWIWGICKSLADELLLKETKLFLNYVVLFDVKRDKGSKAKYLNSSIASNKLWGSRLFFYRYCRFKQHMLFVFNLPFPLGKQK